MPVHRHRVARVRSCAIIWLAAVAAGHATSAADPPPAMVAGFTRQVQPLLLNKCAAGACHGRADAPAFQLQRGPSGGSLDRLGTLANLRAFLGLAGPDRDAGHIVATLAVRHPASAPQGGFTAAPLSSRDRITIESWLQAAKVMSPVTRQDPAVIPAAATVAAPIIAPSSNRLRTLLETGAPPAAPPAIETDGRAVFTDRIDRRFRVPDSVRPAPAPR